MSHVIKCNLHVQGNELTDHLVAKTLDSGRPRLSTVTSSSKCYGVFTRSSKRPAIHVYFEYICWKFAGGLLDRVNTLLVATA